ncbi:MAG: exo-alpha-sialidase [bacterium]|nr:exo-alpha-sialidase [bacterium]
MAINHSSIEDRLGAFARALVNQKAARVIVPANEPSSGFWFGGGNMVQSADGDLWLVGRYRNFGDSRTGLYAGDRGLELAIFRSTDRGKTFEKAVSFSKSELNVGDQEVLSIEGACLAMTDSGVELFVSTEKTNRGYPSPWESHLKPGTGVWTIDHLQADSVAGLTESAVRTVISSDAPESIHVKDPFFVQSKDALTLFYCTHPFAWSSSNTAYAVRPTGSEDFEPVVEGFFTRGAVWDVAMTRGTCIVDVPRVGPLADESIKLMFYDGGECLRNHDEHAAAVKRFRGYSCEEIGGVAYTKGDWNQMKRLSRYQPWFVSPFGTGCSRYVDVCETADGYYTTWQQSQDDLSQPLVMTFLSRNDAEFILKGE